MSDEWDKHTIYHGKDWLSLIEKNFRVAINFLATSNLNNEMLAITPVATLNRVPFVLMGTPLRGTNTATIGPLFRRDTPKSMRAEAFMSQLEVMLANSDYLEVGLTRENESLLNEPTMKKLGFKPYNRNSLSINLNKPEAELWNSISGRARNMVRKSIKAGCCAKIINPSKSWIDNYYKLLTDTFNRQGMHCPHPHGFFNDLIELVSVGDCIFIDVTLDGETCAAGIFLVSGDEIIFLSGVSSHIGNKCAASSLLQWHLIEHASRIGLQSYDLGGLGVDSIDKFKRSFSKTEISYKRWISKRMMYSIVEPVAIWAHRRQLFRLFDHVECDNK